MKRHVSYFPTDRQKPALYRLLNHLRQAFRGALNYSRASAVVYNGAENGEETQAWPKMSTELIQGRMTNLITLYELLDETEI